MPPDERTIALNGNEHAIYRDVERVECAILIHPRVSHCSPRRIELSLMYRNPTLTS